MLYMQGLGVPHDDVQAYFWFSLDDEGTNAAYARDHLTPAEIRGVERLISEWKQKHVLRPEVAAAIDVLEAKSR
jgi:TPR repeat protein